MILESLSYIFIRLWEILLKSWRLPPPALPNMRLHPPRPTSDEGGQENAPQENSLMMQFYTWEAAHPQMSWWRHFETEVPKLAALGVTQVWLPPPNKAMRKEGQGYDAYDLWDLGEFYQKGTIPTRWGTKEELVRAVATAKAHGIDVLIDAVLNHKLGADRPEKFTATPVDPDNRLIDLGPPIEIEGWTAFDFDGRAEKYSSLKWTYEHFTGVDWDHKTRKKGIYRITSPKHKGWSKWVDSENGNYDYLLGIDIDHRHPAVREDLMAWGSWVLKTTGAAGFRFDAIKHMDRRFLLSFIKHVREALGRNDMFAVAEYWSQSVELIKPYIRTFEGLVTFFDVPLHYNFHNASKGGSAYDLRRIMDDSVLQLRPGDAVTFVDNHECQIGQTLESWVGPNFKLQAYALILLYGAGHPCVFYGDLYPNKECYDARIASGLSRLLAARKRFAYGTRTDYFEQHNCIGFVRAGSRLDIGEGKQERGRPGCVVLVSNAERWRVIPTLAGKKGEEGKDADTLVEDTPVEDTLDADTLNADSRRAESDGEDADSKETHTLRMNVGSANAGATFRAYAPFRPEEAVQIDQDGWGDFLCPFGALRVWVRAEDVGDEELEGSGTDTDV